MKPWNQNNLIQFGVIIACALVICSTIAACYFVAKAGGIWSMVLPIVAICYAIYTFFKKFYKKDEVNHPL